ncbi:MAG: hypothetical protein ACOX2O_07400 [Bdellovibrionota bacterium]|jgi:hypothetical protein
MKRTFEIILYLIPVTIFLILKAYSAVPFVGDENIYFYSGWATLQGVVPFKELPFAHPPLHLFIAVIWMVPNSINPLWLKLASVLPATLCLIAVMFLLRRLKFSRSATFVGGLTLATTYEYLVTATHFTGANWSMLFVVLGLTFCLKDSWRGFVAGLYLACATLVSLHTIPVACSLVLLSFLTNYKKRWYIVLGFGATFITVHALCLLLFGSPYLDQLLLYHAKKTVMPDGGMETVRRFLFTTYPILVPASLGVLLLLKDLLLNILKGERTKISLGEVHLGALIAIIQFCAVILNSRVYSYYFAPILPLAVILVAYTFDKGIFCLKGVMKGNGDSFRNLILGLAFVGIAVVAGERSERELSYYAKEKNREVYYTFKPSQFLPNFINKIVEKTVFKQKRRIGEFDLGLTRYLWHEFVSPDPSVILPDLLAHKDLAGTIFGDASSVPYLALASGRHIALEMPDTNAQLLKSGIVKIEDLLLKLQEDLPSFIVINPQKGIPSHNLFKKFTLENYTLLSRKRSGTLQLMLFMKKR